MTALTALIHSGLKPCQLTSLAALDSTRLQSALAKEFGVRQDKVTGACTYGGHGEAMAVFASKVRIDGKPWVNLRMPFALDYAVDPDSISESSIDTEFYR